MREYHKINTIWKRSEDGRIIEGDYSLPEFEYLANCEWEWTEKVDGTNIRVIRSGGKWEFNGKTDNASIPKQLLDWLTEHFVKWLPPAAGDDDLCLYGEGFGWKIQKAGPRYSAESRFILFDVKIGQWWLRRADVEEMAAKFSVPVVPIVGYGTLREACIRVQESMGSLVADDRTLESEGLVLRPLERLLDGGGNRIISKIKAVDYRKLAAHAKSIEPS